MGASGGWSGEAMVTSTSLSVRHWGRVIEAMMAICSAVNIPAVDIDEASESLASWAGLYRKGAAEDARRGLPRMGLSRNKECSIVYPVEKPVSIQCQMPKRETKTRVISNSLQYEERGKKREGSVELRRGHGQSGRRPRSPIVGVSTAIWICTKPLCRFASCHADFTQ
jgi:hypothetical protein